MQEKRIKLDLIIHLSFEFLHFISEIFYLSDILPLSLSFSLQYMKNMKMLLFKLFSVFL